MEKIVRDAHRAMNNHNQLVLSAQNHLSRLEEVTKIPCFLQAVETDQPLKCTLPNNLLKDLRSYASIEGGSGVRAQLKLAKDATEDLSLSPVTSPLPTIDTKDVGEPALSDVPSSCDTSEVGSVVDQKEQRSVRTKKKGLKASYYRKRKIVLPYLVDNLTFTVLFKWWMGIIDVTILEIIKSLSFHPLKS